MNRSISLKKLVHLVTVVSSQNKFAMKPKKGDSKINGNWKKIGLKNSGNEKQDTVFDNPDSPETMSTCRRL